MIPALQTGPADHLQRAFFSAALLVVEKPSCQPPSSHITANNPQHQPCCRARSQIPALKAEPSIWQGGSAQSQTPPCRNTRDAGTEKPSRFLLDATRSTTRGAPSCPVGWVPASSRLQEAERVARCQQHLSLHVFILFYPAARSAAALLFF